MGKSEFPHYYKDVENLKQIDVYRVIELFNVPAGAIDHAVKKLLCAGNRGTKDQVKDIEEAVKSLNRWLEMRREDATEITPYEYPKDGHIQLYSDNNSDPAFGFIIQPNVTVVNHTDGSVNDSICSNTDLSKIPVSEITDMRPADVLKSLFSVKDNSEEVNNGN
jgi:hypothetical protein